MTKSKIATTELKETLSRYDKDMKALVSIKPQQFDIPTIATMVSATPERKWNAAQGFIHATILKKDCDSKLKTIRATNMLKANTLKEKLGLTNAEDRKAWVEDQNGVRDAEIDAINAEAELLSAKLAYECLDDLFTAGKKIMDWLVKQEQATGEYQKFVNEGKGRR